MVQRTIIDTGPLVTLLTLKGEHASWTLTYWKKLKPPLLTCEPVLSEAAFLLNRAKLDAIALFALVERDLIEIDFSIQKEWGALRALMRRYKNVPMSLADACLVRQSELHSDSVIFTLDSDFRIYRKHTNRMIPLLLPPNK